MKHNKQEKEGARSEKKVKTRIRLINKRSGIAIAGVFVAFVVALVTLSVGPLIANSSIFSSSPVGTDSGFVMEEVKLNAAHNSRQLVMHDHVQLQVKVQGSDIVVPAMIGISPIFYEHHSLDPFGIQDPLMAPMHTHESDGLIHIESTEMREYTLGEFLQIWGMDLAKPTETGENQMTATLTVDGVQVSDYRNHILRNGQNIELEFS